ARKQSVASRAISDGADFYWAPEFATAAQILSRGCALPCSLFAATPGRAETRCGIPRPTSFPDTLDTVPDQCAGVVVPVPEIPWPAESVARSSVTGRTPVRWRVGSGRVGGRR